MYNFGYELFVCGNVVAARVWWLIVVWMGVFVVMFNFGRFECLLLLLDICLACIWFDRVFVNGFVGVYFELVVIDCDEGDMKSATVHL